MDFDWVTFGLQLVNVLILLGILWYFLFRPVADIIAERQAQTDEVLARAEAAREEAQKAAAEAEAKAEQNAAARHKILTDAHAEADAERRRLIAEARAEAERLVADARAEAARTAKEAENATLDRARDLALDIASRALSDLPDPPTFEGYSKRLADALQAMSEEKRRALIGGRNLRLVSARALPNGAVDRMRSAIGPLGVDGFETDVDPALIAGLELRSASGVLHNSLAHDISRIAEAMTDGDG